MSSMSFETENVSRYKPQITRQYGQIAIHSDNVGYREQLTKHSILPLVDRPKPLIDMAKVWTPLIPRVKLLGVFGILDPDEGVRGQRRIPEPYPYTKFRWPAGKDIARIPSVIQSPVTTGPTRTISPQQRDITRQTMSGRISVQI